MKVTATSLATERRTEVAEPGVLVRMGVWILRRLLPAENPDLEGLHEVVRLWWVEIDEHGRPQREIGFDGSGQLGLCHFRVTTLADRPITDTRHRQRWVDRGIPVLTRHPR